MMNKEIVSILELLLKERNFDFTGYRSSMLERRIQKRLFESKTHNYSDYYNYILSNPGEIEKLIDVLTINVSHFFRNTLYFDYLSKIIVPGIISEKANDETAGIRVWSAGCAKGEEPYSVGIILKEALKKCDKKTNVKIFASDIDEKAINIALKGAYIDDYIENVPYGLLKKYFTKNDNQFIISKEIVNLVEFSVFDLVNLKNHFPPNSIYGGFDIVLCRNVLIYFNLKYQIQIYNKLIKSLSPGGYLILGEAESLPSEFSNNFKQETTYLKIFRKNNF